MTAGSFGGAFPRIIVASRVKAGRLLTHQGSDIQCLISIGGPGDPHPAGFARVPRRLRLVFSDIEAETDDDIPPRRADVERIVAFAGGVVGCAAGTTLIHCEAGISRSSAAALILLATIAGPHRERDAAAELFRIHPDACPNTLMVTLADEVLGRDGRLVAALADRFT